MARKRNFPLLLALLIAVLLSAPACNLAALAPTPRPTAKVAWVAVPPSTVAPTLAIPTVPSQDALQSPTPNPPRPLPDLRTEEVEYVVQWGDTLGLIAQRYNVTLEALMSTNGLTNPNLLDIGQVLLVPVPEPEEPAPDFKIIPDSELVNGPASASFDVEAFVNAYGGYLSDYQEEVDEKLTSGAQIVARIAREYSVNPRLLLAVIEHQSGWLTQPNPASAGSQYMLGNRDSWREGLYRQLAWAADRLNYGYYLWRVNAVSGWTTLDNAIIPADATINAGTAGVQQLFALLYDEPAWRTAVSPDGFYATFASLFGDPFQLAYEPLLPSDLSQPELQLPFELGVPWLFTGGPHGGWDDGSAWAALDFVPDGPLLGCYTSDEWVVAMADGLVVRAENGAVVQDLDGDGLEQTGWTLLYMHVSSYEQVQVGTYLKAGERIGHPSCEGGIASGTHVHIARRYNGEWIPADGPLPFVMDGWVSAGAGVLYEGTLQRGGQVVVACECQDPTNTLQR